MSLHMIHRLAVTEGGAVYREEPSASDPDNLLLLTRNRINLGQAKQSIVQAAAKKDSVLLSVAGGSVRPAVLELVRFVLSKEEDLVKYFSLAASPERSLSPTLSLRNEKKLHGPTKGVYLFLINYKLHSGVEPEGLPHHPAYKAYAFCRKQGASKKFLLDLLYYMGDLRSPLARASVTEDIDIGTFSHHDELGLILDPNGEDTLQDIMANHHNNASLVSHLLQPAQDMLDAYADSDPSESFIRALEDYYFNFVTGDLDDYWERRHNAGRLIFCAGVVILLLINEWISVEYHPDLFNSTVFANAGDYEDLWREKYKGFNLDD